MSDKSKTSNLASLVSLADLGASLRQDFQSRLAASSSGWLDGQPLSDADSQELHALELAIDDLWRIGGDLFVLAIWLTSGFLSATQAEPFVRGKKGILTDDGGERSTWQLPSSQPTTSRPFRTSAEMTFAEDEFLAERGPTVFPGQNHPTPARPLAVVREGAVARQMSSPEATAPFILHAGSTLENTTAAREEAAIIRQQAARPYTPPAIRSLKDLASRLRTSSVDEHALSAESTTERSVAAEPEILATIARDTDNPTWTATTFPQAGDRARTTSPTAGPRRTNNFFATTDRVSTMSDADFANSPAEPLVLGATRAIESLARLGIMTSAEAASEDRRDSTLLSTGSVRSRFALPQLRNSLAPPFANEGDTVFPTTEDERQRQTQPMATRSISAVTQASVTDQASLEANDPHASATAQRALAGSNLAGLPEALERPGRFTSSEGLSTEDVDTLLESLEREIEHEYRRYYRD